MTTKPSSSDEPVVFQTRETSPFFSLSNEDGSNTHPEYDSDQYHQYPPVTLSCAHCERIVGDSSAFLFATRQMGTITLSRMVSIAVGFGGLKTSLEGEWDEFCNYKDITCGKCTTALGKMYYATTSKLSALQNKYTLHLTALSFYHHASGTPSLPIAATSEIYAQLHPSPEALAENIDHIMTICVMLREEQGDIIRELKKLGVSTGFDVDLEDGGTSGDGSDMRDDWKEKVQALDELMEKVKSLEETVERMKTGSANEGKAKDHVPVIQEALGGGESVVSEDHKDEEETEVLKEPRRKKQSDDIVASGFLLQPPLTSRRQEKKAHQTPPPIYKRKRKSTNESAIATAAGKQVHVDQSSTAVGKPRPRSQSQSRRKSKKEVPNSQSADEAEASVEEIPGPLFQASVNNDECEEGGEEGGEEDEIEEDRVKSPAEKRRKGIAVSIVSKKGAAGGRVSLARKGYK